MNARDRALRNNRICNLFANGKEPKDIAAKVGLDTATVRDILIEHDLLQPVGRRMGSQNSILDMSDDNKRRMAIWNRQREGARETLKAIRR